MPLNFPSSPSDGQIYTDDNSAVWQYDATLTVWNIVTGTTKKLFNGVSLGLSANVSLTTTSTALSWDVENYDQGGYHNSTNPTRATAPSAGYYALKVVLFSDSQGSGYSAVIKKNGSTTIATASFNANQTTDYEEVLQLNTDDYIEVFVSESSGTAAITTSTLFELTLLGQTVGTGISSYAAFSGVKAVLTSAESSTSTPTAVSWDSTEYDTNSNAEGLLYWSAGTPTRLTAKSTGYFNIDVYLQTGSTGGVYTLTIKKNGSTNIVSSTMSANDTAIFEQTIALTADDYLELFLSDTDATGTLTADTHFEITRMGY